MATARLYRDTVTKITYETLKKMHLRPVKRLLFKFDPFHPEVTSIRNFLYHVNGEKLRLTNPNCVVKTEIMSDRSIPQIDIVLDQGKTYRLITDNLTLLEIVQQVDQICRKYDPKPTS